jgi:hypothetical protein
MSKSNKRARTDSICRVLFTSDSPLPSAPNGIPLEFLDPIPVHQQSQLLYRAMKSHPEVYASVLSALSTISAEASQRQHKDTATIAIAKDADETIETGPPRVHRRLPWKDILRSPTERAQVAKTGIATPQSRPSKPKATSWMSSKDKNAVTSTGPKTVDPDIPVSSPFPFYLVSN